MSAQPQFDPYHRWLGIPPGEDRHHYRLLGLPLFETDPAVIDAGADRQMAFVKNQASGPYAKQSQQILNELALARVCLLNPRVKTEYDAELRSQLDQPLEEVVRDDAPRSFDPYHQWLGISPREQPPDYYRLLNISSDENDPDVIKTCAQRQAFHLQRHLDREHADEARRILAEIEQAMEFLLASSRGDQALSSAGAGVPIVASSDSGAAARLKKNRSRKQPLPKWTAPAIAGAVTVVLLVALIAILAGSDGGNPRLDGGNRAEDRDLARAKESHSIIEPSVGSVAASGAVPIIQPIQDQSVTAGQVVRLQLKANGGEEGIDARFAHHWNLITGPPGASLDPILGSFVWQSTDATIGKHDIIVSATNVESRQSSTKSFHLTVNAMPDKLQLLDVIHTDRDAVKGPWLIDRHQSLVCESYGDFALLEIPFVPPTRFRLRIEAARLGEGSDFYIYFPFNGAQAEMIFDTSRDRGYLSGLQLIDGKRLVENGDSIRGQCFPHEEPVTLDLTVDGEMVRVERNGRLWYRRRMESNRLSSGLSRPTGLLHSNLGLGLWKSAYRVLKVELTKLGSDAKTSADDGQGLMAEVFRGRELQSDPIHTRIDRQIAFEWGGGRIDPNLPDTDNVSIRWSGYLTVPEPGGYQLYSRTDDGERVFIDGEKVIEQWYLQGYEWHGTKAPIPAGKHKFVFEYQEYHSYAGCRLYWQGPNDPERFIVPPEAFSHDPLPSGVATRANIEIAGSTNGAETGSETARADDCLPPDLRDAWDKYISAIKRIDEVFVTERKKLKTTLVSDLEEALPNAADAVDKNAEEKIQRAIQAIKNGEAPLLDSVKDSPSHVRPPKFAVEFAGHHYAVIPKTATWHVAQSRCLANGGYLVRIESPEENTFVRQLIARFAKIFMATKIGHTCHVGGSDQQTKGRWAFDNGNPLTYTNWRTGEPNGLQGRALCIEMGFDGGWNDDQAGCRRPYVCEWGGPPPVSTDPWDFRHLVAREALSKYHGALRELKDQYNGRREQFVTAISIPLNSALKAAEERGDKVQSQAIIRLIEAVRHVQARMVEQEKPSAKVPPDAVEFKGHHYKRFNDGMTVHVAAGHCRLLGGHLVQIESADENEFVATSFVAQTGTEYCWIDGSDEITEGTWLFRNGAPMKYQNWDGKEPGNANGVQHAIVMQTNGHWRDAFSGERNSFICEWDE